MPKEIVHPVRTDEIYTDRKFRMAYVDAWVRQVIQCQVIRERKARGWTQAHLAKRCGMKQSVISRIECERAALTIRTLERLAEAFGGALVVEIVPLDEFRSRTFPKRLVERNNGEQR